ncbi:dihydrofolate reductase family protein [Thermopolyspora sp. NPDC052614]|uniref:RibD family protein n=1 Tax=Thermopolyspora sp. NPDC052614 TaxID=3155682 RepID=UPI0034478017
MRPYVLLSCAMSIDGYIDDTSPERLLLSNADDFDRVDQVRAGCDAIMVGAGTVRSDNPRLLVRSPDRRRERVERGLPEHPIKVTLTAGGDLDPESAFFTAGDGEKLVYASPPAARRLTPLLQRATVIDTGGAGDSVDLGLVLDDLGRRGVRRLMVEGGGGLHTRFLRHRLADELQLVIAPVFVGDPAAPRFVLDGGGLPSGRLNLTEVTRIGDVVLLRYLLR